jgi:hypothetical protein
VRDFIAVENKRAFIWLHSYAALQEVLRTSALGEIVKPINIFRTRTGLYKGEIIYASHINGGHTYA